MVSIYRGMDQTELDEAYNNLALVKNSAQIIQSWSHLSEEYRNAHKNYKELVYGLRSRNCIDYFSCGSSNKALFIFIHGGYWQRNNKSLFSFIAKSLNCLDINVAILAYTLAPEVSLFVMVEEVSIAIDALHVQAESLGFNPFKIIVGGWSAGGHLAAMAAHNPKVESVVTISGLFDLEPIYLSYVNRVLCLKANDIKALSPIHLSFPKKMAYALFVGGNELSELKRQSRLYYDALNDDGQHVSLNILESQNHFTILNELATHQGIIAESIVRLASN